MKEYKIKIKIIINNNWKKGGWEKCRRNRGGWDLDQRLKLQSLILYSSITPFKFFALIYAHLFLLLLFTSSSKLYLYILAFNLILYFIYLLLFFSLSLSHVYTRIQITDRCYIWVPAVGGICRGTPTKIIDSWSGS